MYSACELCLEQITLQYVLTGTRIDGLLPNTPAARKSAIKKKETPTSRIKSEHPASSPDQRSTSNLKEQLDSMGAMP